MRSNYFSTDLHFRIKEMEIFEKTAEQNAIDQHVILRKQAIESFMKDMTLTSEQAAQQLKESGYRNLTLGDVTELVKDNGLRYLVNKDGSEIDLTAITKEKHF